MPCISGRGLGWVPSPSSVRFAPEATSPSGPVSSALAFTSRTARFSRSRRAHRRSKPIGYQVLQGKGCSLATIARSEGATTRRSLIAILLVLGFVASACDSGRTSVLELGVGDCFNDEDLEAEVITVVPTVPCSEPHDNEIYLAYDMTDAVYPGREAALDAAGQRCFDQFESFVGRDYFESDLDFFPLVPTAESWDQGDREVLCVVYAVDLSKLTGSMRNSQR